MTLETFYIGCHLSISQGFAEMGRTALSIGANTMQFFTRNPRGGSAKEISEEDVKAFLDLKAAHGIGPIVAHAPYTLNACSADARTRDFALMTFADDLKRMEYVPGNYYNFHPGSHVGQGIDVGIELISTTLNQVMTHGQSTIVLLETMAGKGSEVGSRFEELEQIIEKTEYQDKIGVCLDTCHVFDSGMDIVADLDGILENFDKIIGLERLKAIHLNDSLYGFQSHKDRHAVIGGGKIGEEALATVINHPALRSLPFLLETPNELDGYAKEIARLKSLRN